MTIDETDRARKLFLSVIAHDLRDAIFMIENCVQQQLRARPEGVLEANITLRATARLKALVGDLLEATIRRPDAAALSIQPSSIQLDRFVRDTLDEFVALNPGRIIELESAGNLQGTWDARRLHQVISNVVFNALKHGAPETQVRVTLDGNRPDEVEIAVHNFGNPIPRERLSRLFDPFIEGRAQDLASHPMGANIGFGLYVARAIVAAHSGTIGVTSSDADGVLFSIRLPRHCAAAASRATP
ncbi:HAMP domain-containing sensor histidine kinase [Variovorax sp. J22R133]|uniref:sensor histidine kinase n=1 Tax=Variovorax brevis TaxID=3053503 RepID=UPI0025762C6A|nr:HAMP domain-containing sensor histidine kinase [Variovorax sp. J22R133]MDM0112298.1 HAMP domain-containing sensor histidine kinase [Variovorax sp. J22R133]